jgi:hypothetical protein
LNTHNGILDYSCAFEGVRQGWMYISEFSLCFYAFILGIETKIQIPLRDIKDVRKERSKRGLIPDSLVLTTKDGKTVSMHVLYEIEYSLYDELVFLFKSLS